MKMGREQKIEVQGRPVVVWRRGPKRISRTTPSLVLVPGAGDTHHAYDALLPFMDEIDCIVPALPGREGSEGPPFTRMKEVGAWLSALLDVLDLQRPYVAGHSMGGGAALEWAIQAAEKGEERGAGLILISTGARLRVMPSVMGAYELAAAGGEPVPQEGLFHPDTPADRVARAVAQRLRTPSATSLADWRCADGFDRLSQVGSITIPTCIFSGTEDALTPLKYGLYLEAHIPGSMLVVLQGAGHMLPVEQPEELVAWIKLWMARGEVWFAASQASAGKD